MERVILSKCLNWKSRGCWSTHHHLWNITRGASLSRPPSSPLDPFPQRNQWTIQRKTTAPAAKYGISGMARDTWCGECTCTNSRRSTANCETLWPGRDRHWIPSEDTQSSACNLHNKSVVPGGVFDANGGAPIVYLSECLRSAGWWVKECIWGELSGRGCWNMWLRGEVIFKVIVK